MKTENTGRKIRLPKVLFAISSIERLLDKAASIVAVKKDTRSVLATTHCLKPLEDDNNLFFNKAKLIKLPNPFI